MQVSSVAVCHQEVVWACLQEEAPVDLVAQAWVEEWECLQEVVSNQTVTSRLRKT